MSKHDDDEDGERGPGEGGGKPRDKEGTFLERILFRTGVPRRATSGPRTYTGGTYTLGGPDGTQPLHEQNGVDLVPSQRCDRPELQPAPSPPSGPTYTGGTYTLGGPDGVTQPLHVQNGVDLAPDSDAIGRSRNPRHRRTGTPAGRTRWAGPMAAHSLCTSRTASISRRTSGAIDRSCNPRRSRSSRGSMSAGSSALIATSGAR